MSAENIGLSPVAVEQLIGREPCEVEHLGRVDESAGLSRRGDLVKPVIVLRPEGGAPRFIEGVDVVVFAFKPAVERSPRDLAVAGLVVAAVLVVHVPHDHCRMRRIPFRNLRGQRRGRPPVFRA